MIERQRINRGHGSQQGQVIPLFALFLLVILAIVGVAVDGSFGLVQERRTQNAADFAAIAGTEMLAAQCSGDVRSNLPTIADVMAQMQQVINQNSPGTGTDWSATFLGPSPTRTPILTVNPKAIPAGYAFGACGVDVDPQVSWNTALGVFDGQTTETTQANGLADNNPTGTPLAAIVSLNKVGPHDVLGGGTGNFVVNGNVYLNTNVADQPWSEARDGTCTPDKEYTYDDAIDAKQNSNLYVYGNIYSVNDTSKLQAGTCELFPLDWCFGTNEAAPNLSSPPVTTAQYPWNLSDGGSPPPIGNGPGDAAPPTEVAGTDDPQCPGSPTVDYDYIGVGGGGVPLADPVGTTSTCSNPPSVPDPFACGSDGVCPGAGSTAPTISSLPTAGNVTLTNGTVVPNAVMLQPGFYPNTVSYPPDTNVFFADCSGNLDSATAPDNFPGIFRFEHGLWLQPASGYVVQGNNVTLAASGPAQVAGNVPGSIIGGKFVASGALGNGAPCIKPGSSDTDGTPASYCGGTALEGAHAWQQSGFAADDANDGTGSNFSVELGGQGTITLTSPPGSKFEDMALYQEVTTGGGTPTPANFGLDASPGDSASVTINGLAYNNSLPGEGVGAPGFPVVQDAWDAGIPFYQGGTLQTGFGTGGGDGLTASAGRVILNGISVVDDFNTDGGTGIYILGGLYNFPTGTGGSSLTP